ncbi:hypothetical protein AVEN_215265-1 [Araneus ventricosus]|uniref:Uncharacterized protein n=1 Tax=Araneus ventricosus TaxID=182803 RepID=A0A4Y2NZ93_ARAVE|nr:hypothetical protein AVEN_184332-1 [Araneus ventricosus]GBN43662.1 hypothetical protein AVEN_215265-1 [Araneus ventricosus]
MLSVSHYTHWHTVLDFSLHNVQHSRCYGDRSISNTSSKILQCWRRNLPLHQLQNIWFEHVGAPPHKISNVKQYLMEAFQNQVIKYGGFVKWPLDPDLTPVDFFLWGHIKEQVYPN